jgi:Asp-tRNA(Asn)/Glu-tRNA(Gln) amidotransferase A subunit family amidase
MSPSLIETARALATGTLPARACTQHLLAQIRERDANIQAWAALDEARALALAAECDRRRATAADHGALHGVPVGVKDIIATADLPTEMGSPAFAGHRPARDAAVVERLKRAGGFVLGKTVTTEFAFMHPGKTRNPWNPQHTPGGSSSGSAAAVAAGFVPAAIGTQTNGSVIRPAAFCGVVGFKPTFGLLPFAGTNQLSESLDQLGTFGRSVADVALFTAQLAEGEAIPADVPPLERPPWIGVLPRFPWNDAEAEAQSHFEIALDALRSADARVERLSLPEGFADANLVHRTIMLAEAARNLGSVQSRARALLSPTLNRALDEGAAIAPASYRASIALRGALAERAHDLFARCEVIATPAAPGTAPRRRDVTGDPSFCTLWSLLGVPAITVPSGLAQNGLPFGLQLARDAGGDAHLLRVARWCESVLRFRGLE